MDSISVYFVLLLLHHLTVPASPHCPRFVNHEHNVIQYEQQGEVKLHPARIFSHTQHFKKEREGEREAERSEPQLGRDMSFPGLKFILFPL